MALPVVAEQDAAQIRMAVEADAEHVVALALHPVGAAIDRHERRARETPGPSRVFISTAMPSSRLSTRATTSSPCSFQSTAVENEKKRQPRSSFAKSREGQPLVRPARVTTSGASPLEPARCRSARR